MPIRKLFAAGFVSASLLLGGCATILGPNGQAQAVVVGCESTSPAKSVACASATLKSLINTADLQLAYGRLTLDQADRLKTRFSAAYAYIEKGAQLAQVGNGDYNDYLQLAEDILNAIEQELKK